MNKTIIKQIETPAAQQVIERVIVKTEQIETIKVLKTVDELKEQLLKDTKDKFVELSTKPRVEVTLPRVSIVEEVETEAPITFFVDGGRDNKDDFKTKWELMLDAYVDANGNDIPAETTTVKDADNKYIQDITKSEMFIVWTSIVMDGEAIYNWKWSKEDEIKACTTIEQLEAISI